MSQQFTDPIPGPVGVSPPAQLSEAYTRNGWWDTASLASVLASYCSSMPPWRSRYTRHCDPGRVSSPICTSLLGRVSAALGRRGVKPGDVVAIALPNWAEAFAAFYGALLTGAVVLPIPHFYGHREMLFALEQAQARVLIVADRVAGRDVLAEVDGIRAMTPALDLVVVGDRAPPWACTFEDFIDVAPCGDTIQPDPAATAAIAYTSGTGASPKGVLLSHRALLFELRHHMTGYVRPTRPPLMGLPASHVGGMLFTSLHPVLTGETAVRHRLLGSHGCVAGDGGPKVSPREAVRRSS